MDGDPDERPTPKAAGPAFQRHSPQDGERERFERELEQRLRDGYREALERELEQRRKWEKHDRRERATVGFFLVFFIWWALLILSHVIGMSFDGTKALLLAVIMSVCWVVFDDDWLRSD